MLEVLQPGVGLLERILTRRAPKDRKRSDDGLDCGLLRRCHVGCGCRISSVRKRNALSGVLWVARDFFSPV